MTDYARKMSLDLRMIDENGYSDHIDNKASHCAKLLNDYYRKYDAQKGTQFVFSDLGTYKPGGDFNIYSEVKRKLVEDYHIPSYEIRFIQECKNEKAKKAMVEAMNRGDIRIIFGSTSMLGTGVNAQQRAVAVHQLDTPWRPSDLEQRNGRAIRKGNMVAKEFADNKVDVIIYAVERSLDSYKFNLLHNKQLFINQLKTNTLGSRTIDEGSMDEDSGMNFSEYVAVLSANTDLLEKARLDKKITTLESERKNFLRERDAATGKLAEIDSSVNRFFVKGQESIYYTYNNGKLATDPKLACENFLGALGRIPKVIESHEKEKEKVAANKEIYTAIANGTWKKEDELRSLKGQVAELDRKIALTLSADKEDKEEQGNSLSENETSISIKIGNEQTQEADNRPQSFRPKWRH